MNELVFFLLAADYREPRAFDSIFGIDRGSKPLAGKKNCQTKFHGHVVFTAM